MRVPIRARDVLLDRLPRNAAGAEIGVHLGEFSARILEIAQPRLLHLIDPWVPQERASAESWYGTHITQESMNGRHDRVVTQFAAQIEAGTIVVHRAFSDKAAAAIEDRSLQFVYLDGDHTYEGVKTDMRLYTRKLAAGGLLCGDDYMLGHWWGDGVVRALHELLTWGKFKIEFLIDGQFCLRKLPR